MIKVSELTGALLDYWVARAEGLEMEMLCGHCCTPVSRHHDEIQYEMYRPSTDWGQGGPLIDKYGLTVEPYPPAWWANEPDESAVMGEDPLQAICRAVVRAAFGDEVEEVLP